MGRGVGARPLGLFLPLPAPARHPQVKGLASSSHVQKGSQGPETCRNLPEVTQPGSGSPGTPDEAACLAVLGFLQETPASSFMPRARHTLGSRGPLQLSGRSLSAKVPQRWFSNWHPQLTAPTLPGNLSKMQITGLHPRPPVSEFWGWGPGICVFTRLPDHSDAHWPTVSRTQNTLGGVLHPS